MTEPRVVVLGAGAFGAWTALELVRRGAAVTLVDAWGPGNARASSGGRTRVIRATYGSQAVYTRMAAHALKRWQEYDRRWNAGLLRKTGALWLLGEGTSFGEASARTLRSEGIAVAEIALSDAMRRFPQIGFNGISGALFEPDAGYLFARRACAHVAGRANAEGAAYRQAAAASPAIVDERGVRLTDGSTVDADIFVFACGPWLGSLFPDIIGSLITPTRQEVYYFGIPAGDTRFASPALPVWLECGERFTYGIPADDGGGFKLADDTSGPVMDPTSDERVVTRQGVRRAREYLTDRFPALHDAPLVGSEICQYESTPDSHFLIDRHPHDDRIWIAGGGSGHGFKMGPAVGEMIAGLLLKESSPDPRFTLERFKSPPEKGWTPKWS
jgi:glycine/D-amino acid oxidase-like deaminating enzyme